MNWICCKRLTCFTLPTIASRVLFRLLDSKFGRTSYDTSRDYVVEEGYNSVTQKFEMENVHSTQLLSLRYDQAFDIMRFQLSF